MSGSDHAAGREIRVNPIACLLCLLLWSGPFRLQPVQFPEDGFIKGWNRIGSRASFDRNGLFNYIDGGAELFLEFGFQILQLQRYGRQKDEISVEAYLMEDPAAALGIYLLKCGPESPIPALPARNSGDRYQLAMVRGATYIVINNYSGAPELLPVMGELATKVLASLEPVPETASGAILELLPQPGSGAPELLPVMGELAAKVLASLEPVPETASGAILELLPQPGQIPGTRRIIRGPYSLQSIFTFGEGDMLLLEGKILAAAADYRECDGSAYSRIMVRYPDEGYARAAFLHLQNHLDSYIRVLNRSQDRFVFVDFQNRYGRVERRNDLVDIGVRFVHNPDHP